MRCPLPVPARWRIDVEGFGCARHDVEDAVRLHLRAIKAGKAVEVHVSREG